MEILKIRFFHAREGPNIDCEPNFHEATTLNIGDYPGHYNTEGNGEPPLKMENLKILFFHVRKGPNIGSETIFQDHTTSNGGDYRGQPKPKF